MLGRSLTPHSVKVQLPIITIVFADLARDHDIRLSIVAGWLIDGSPPAETGDIAIGRNSFLRFERLRPRHRPANRR